ncbi:MAG: hypothetical protein U1E24_17850 [Phenylobacterium sp.]|nr:hypothetical protein [Phenylobacterium sp.]
MALLIMASVLSAMVLLGASAAHADPCKAIPDTGPLPGYLYPGARFAGPVVHIGDGDSLCVAVGAGPQNWVEVRISGFYAPELHEPDGKQAKAALSSIARGRSVRWRRKFGQLAKVGSTSMKDGLYDWEAEAVHG